MPKYWRISDRAIKKGQPSSIERGPLTFWISDKLATDGTIDWQSVSQDQFKKLLIAASDAFDAVENPADQPHVTFFVHGYNVGWQAASNSYQNLCARLFDGAASLGLCVSFDWPSYGNILGYYPDRAHARACAQDLTDVLSALFDWLAKKQDDALKYSVAVAQQLDNPKVKLPAAEPCKAKLSVISHSMGNYVLQKAMAAAWTRKNQPLLVSLINQLVMVAADVDNDLFDAGAPDYDDGKAIVNFTYRITALYSGRDEVLGASAGLKHFGTRRLGRSGLANDPPLATHPPAIDNVWEIDCSPYFQSISNGMDIHGACFVTPATIDIMRQVLKGIDRSFVTKPG
jgi:esterase/lipase superfamily enzyme